MILVSSSFSVEKVRFKNVFCPHYNAKPAFSNSSDLKIVYEKLRFRDSLLYCRFLGCHALLF